MESIMDIIRRELTPEQREQRKKYLAMSCEERQRVNLESDISRWNKRPGRLNDINCPECLNRGNIAVEQNNQMVIRKCQCQVTRENMARIKASGLAESVERLTFENYWTAEAWQKTIKANAMEFLKDCKGKWYFISGQPGTGKTHICTSITGELLKSGLKAHYMLWRDESVRLKAAVNDEDEYFKHMEPLKMVDVLYIDDFLKHPRTSTSKEPTAGDINVAFELINSRYINQNKITIISTEYDVNEIIGFDGALGSRIYERSKGYNNTIAKAAGRNYRLRE